MDQNTGYDDAPETPAPLFALKAFRHAIFGTPKAEDNTTRPKQTRASTLPNRTAARQSLDLGSSPTKGILLTPGTSASKRKTVTFRAQQEREERKRLGATPHAPGHFPNLTAGEVEPKGKPCTGPTGTQSSTRTGTDADQQSSVHLRGRFGSHTKNNKGSGTTGEEDVTTDMSAPRSASGKYWKSEFDSFSSKSAQEMRKLSKKERLAKTYAKTKDDEALELRDQLKQEQRKVADLERRLAEYKGRLSRSIGVLQQPNTEGGGVDRRELGVKVQSHVKEAVKQQSQDDSILGITDPAMKLRSFRKSNRESIPEGKQGVAEPVEPLRQLEDPSDRGFMRQNRSAAGFPSSDIWADIGNTSNVAGDPAQAMADAQQDPPKEFSMKSPARRPLRQRSANFEEKAAGNIEPKKSSLSEDRRAAALKRLGDRRKNRQLANSTNGLN